MWIIENAADNTTNKFVVPTDGIISVTKPDSVQANAFVNDQVSAVHHVHVKAGDQVYFRLKNTAAEPTSVEFDFMGTKSTVTVPGSSAMEKEQEEEMTPAETIN